MSGPRLSKEEIDMLLSGICEGRLSVGAADMPDAVSVQAFALSGLERVDPARLPGLERINNRICREAAVTLGDFSGRLVDVVCESIEVKEYGKLTGAVKPFKTFCIAMPMPLNGHSYLIIDPLLTDMLVNAYYGGGEAFRPTYLTGLASLSRAALTKAGHGLMDAIRSCWLAEPSSSEKMAQEFSSLKKGVVEEFDTPLIPDAESVYVSSFKATMSGGVGRFYISIPVDSIKPMVERLINTSDEDERAAWAAALAQGLYDAPIDVSVEMGTANIAIEDLLSLKSGDIIETDRRVKDPVSVLINGMPLLTGLPGAFGSRYAVRLAGDNLLARPVSVVG